MPQPTHVGVALVRPISSDHFTTIAWTMNQTAKAGVAGGGMIGKAMKQEHAFLSSLVQIAGPGRPEAAGTTQCPNSAADPAVRVALRQTMMVFFLTLITTTQLKLVEWPSQGGQTQAADFC